MLLPLTNNLVLLGGSSDSLVFLLDKNRLALRLGTHSTTLQVVRSSPTKIDVEL